MKKELLTKVAAIALAAAVAAGTTCVPGFATTVYAQTPEETENTGNTGDTEKSESEETKGTPDAPDNQKTQETPETPQTPEKTEAVNYSIETAQEIPNNSYKQGSFESDDTYGERWYKFKNYGSKDVVAEISVTKTEGTASTKYAVFSEIGSGEKKSGHFDTNGETIHVGMKAGETSLLRISDPGWSSAWVVSVKMTEEEPNKIASAKKYNSGKRIYGKLDYTKDVDVFKIKAKKSGVMTIKISNNGIAGDFAALEYKVYNKAKVSKAHANVADTKTGVKKIKVKKGQYVYVEVKGYRTNEESNLGEYSIMTKIKK